MTGRSGRRPTTRSGFVPPAELGTYYERATVVTCPSRREGYGVVAREAMAYGRAVVATGVGGLADAVEDGVTGLVVPPNDPAVLRAAIAELLADSDRARDLGRAGRAHAQAQLSWGPATASLVAAYRDALSLKS